MNKKIVSILFVTNNYTPYSGGVVSSIFLHTTALRKQGHTVTIATLDFLNTHHQQQEEHVIRLYCPIRWIMNTNHMAIPWQATKQLEHLIATLQPTIIHVHHPFLLGTAASRVARKKEYLLCSPITLFMNNMYITYPIFLTSFPNKWLLT